MNPFQKFLLKIIFCLTILLSFFTLSAQSQKNIRKWNRAPESGQFELGMRSTLSFFDHQSYSGIGYGGQFRLRATGMVNTEWYADYIRTDIAGLGDRETAHIGWSVMIYPFYKQLTQSNFAPYLIGGNCFDYSRVSSNYFNSPVENYKSVSRTRLTTAVQGGIGASYYIGEYFNLSTSCQYMQHLGNDMHVEVVNTENDGHENGSHQYLSISDNPEKQLILEGHLLVTMSANFLITDFAK